MIFRGILCNILVVLAVWMATSAQDIISKIFACWFPIMLFVLCGFEHSVANMTVFSVALISPAIQGATLAGAIYNLVAVTLGNMVGGVLVMGLGVYIMGSEDKEEKISSIKAV